MLPKLLNFCKQNSKDLFLATIIALVAIIGFGLGRLSKLRELKTPITIENAVSEQSEGKIGDLNTATDASENLASAASSLPVKSSNTSSIINTGNPQINSNSTTAGNLVASKNGTKYYYPWCSGVAKIKEENKVFFPTPEEAAKAGYSPAANCKGLK